MLLATNDFHVECASTEHSLERALALANGEALCLVVPCQLNRGVSALFIIVVVAFIHGVSRLLGRYRGKPLRSFLSQGGGINSFGARTLDRYTLSGNQPRHFSFILRFDSK